MRVVVIMTAQFFFAILIKVFCSTSKATFKRDGSICKCSNFNHELSQIFIIEILFISCYTNNELNNCKPSRHFFGESSISLHWVVCKSKIDEILQYWALSDIFYEFWIEFESTCVTFMISIYLNLYCLKNWVHFILCAFTWILLSIIFLNFKEVFTPRNIEILSRISSADVGQSNLLLLPSKHFRKIDELNDRPLT